MRPFYFVEVRENGRVASWVDAGDLGADRPEGCQVRLATPEEVTPEEAWSCYGGDTAPDATSKEDFIKWLGADEAAHALAERVEWVPAWHIRFCPYDADEDVRLEILDDHEAIEGREDFLRELTEGEIQLIDWPKDYLEAKIEVYVENDLDERSFMFRIKIEDNDE
jgi:hypothetical protein